MSTGPYVVRTRAANRPTEEVREHLADDYVTALRMAAVILALPPSLPVEVEVQEPSGRVLSSTLLAVSVASALAAPIDPQEVSA